MKKSLALSKYLFKLQKKDKMTLFLLFVLPLALFVLNASRYDEPFTLLSSFAIIAPMQSVLFSFGAVFVLYRRSGALIKYQLMNFKPFEVTMGLLINAFLFQALGLISLVGVAMVMQGELLAWTNLSKMLLTVGAINILNIGIVMVLLFWVKTTQDYNNYASIVFYGQIFGLMILKGELPLMLLTVMGILMIAVGLKKFSWHGRQV